MDKYGLGIESSCDETSIAIVKNGCETLSNIIYSQVDEHAPYRGVVPEIASRAHLEKINIIAAEAFRESSVAFNQIDYVAVSNRPGLTGSLMIGAQFAKCFALVQKVPVIAIDHIEAHFYALQLEERLPEYPFLGLLLSGGNSAIFLVKGPQQLEQLADTADDALGEAFDKAAAVLQLAYPGGPAIEALARSYTPQPSDDSLMPRLLKSAQANQILFSFSGIKTAVLRTARSGADPARICYDFQNSVFELVERMILRAVRNTGVATIAAAGGVLANGELRKRLDRLAERHRIDLRYPTARKLCTDNGAMVAALGYALHSEGKQTALDFGVSSKR